LSKNSVSNNNNACRLVLIDIRADLLQQTAQSCASAGALKVTSIAIDLSTKENCE
jgi:hypothetical protein